MKRPTLRDVAREAGVHAATVSRALNPETRHVVNSATAERVEQVAKALGYRPNPIARGLKTARSSTVGLVIPDLTNPLFPPIVRGIEDVLGPAGYSAWVVNTDNDPVREDAAIDSLRTRKVDGYVVATASLHDPRTEELADSGLPVLLVNRRTTRGDIPSVTADDAGGIALAVGHLVDAGHRRIAHLAGPQTLSTGVNRLRAFEHALRDHGIDPDPDDIVVCPTFTEDAGAVAMRHLLDERPDVTAVVAGNDLLALGCYDALRERGLRCPDDVSIVGFNDTPFMDKLDPPLTTVRVPHYDVGAEAARLLLEILADPKRHPRSVLLPVNLVVRQSTGQPRVQAVSP
jgi:LacI family transcriptional regulator